MEPGDAMESAIEYAHVSGDAMDSSARVDAAYQRVFQEEDGEGHRRINLNKDLPDGHRGGRAQGQHHGHRAPGAAHLGRAAVRAPPSSCCLSAEARKGDAKELGRARRRRRRRLEVRVKVNGRVENVSKKEIMMHAIAQTMLLADISVRVTF
uniref:Uncharacterized protein n=1 Tax=Leersia perrieri TaxID=77586 RepID=A0A0D9WCR1_9ORYZ